MDFHNGVVQYVFAEWLRFLGISYFHDTANCIKSFDMDLKNMSLKKC